jgi:DNA-binding CsgD family transcriptional regulator
MKGSKDPLLALIGDVYSMASGSSPWADIAPRIASAFNAPSAQVTINRSGATLHRVSMTDNIRAHYPDYQRYYCQKDLWVKRAADRLDLSQVALGEDLISASEFISSEFYYDWCRRLDIFHLVGAVFDTGQGSLGVLGIHRPRESSAFNELDRHRVGLFLPHLERAVRLWQLLQRSQLQHQLALETLKHSDLGVILVTADSQLVFANPNAELLLRTETCLRVQRGRLMAQQADDNQRLQQSIRTAAGEIATATDAWMAVRSRSGSLEASAFIAPFRAPFIGSSKPAAILFVRRVRQRIVLAQIARRVFCLTPTEARIAEALANGATIENIAHQHHAKLGTVRKQLKDLLHKMGVHRQAECVALLLRTIAPSWEP